MRSVLFPASLAAMLLCVSLATAETAAEKSMAQQIGRQLKESGQLRNYRIGVKYQDGVAWLNGSVASAEQRDAAVRLTEQIAGVSHVVCQLDCPPATEPIGAKASPKLFQAFDETQPTAGQGGPSGVVQAYANASPANAQRAANLQRTNRQVRRNGALSRRNMPLPTPGLAAAGSMSAVRQASAQSVQPASGPYPSAPGAMGMGGGASGQLADGSTQAVPVGFIHHGMGRGPSYENAQMPGYAWPSYASYPNYAALTYPQQYSPTAWPYIGPFYPYPQVPLAWRKVSLEWDDGWWFLDFSAHNSSH
jgi:hypothetical protein